LALSDETKLWHVNRFALAVVLCPISGLLLSLFLYPIQLDLETHYNHYLLLRNATVN